MSPQSNRLSQKSPPSISSLRVTAADAKSKFAARTVEGRALLEKWKAPRSQGDVEAFRSQMNAWDEYNKTLLTTLFDGPAFLQQYRKPGPSFGILDIQDDPFAEVATFVTTVTDKISRLESISEQVDLCPPPPAASTVPALAPNARDRVIQVCRRFPLFARQLQRRHAQRPPLAVDDEYDVQDLIHAILRLEFEDVRPEAWTPSYAGKAARMDFLLKRERLVIEVKRTRDGLGPKELGDQLIVDIDRYKEHPDCTVLVCFVYDPERRVGNPAELEDDLGGNRGDLEVVVIVAPRE